MNHGISVQVHILQPLPVPTYIPYWGGYHEGKQRLITGSTKIHVSFRRHRRSGKKGLTHTKNRLYEVRSSSK